MADTNPIPSPEKSVFVATINVGRLWTLTIVNLTLNIVILVLLFLGMVAHHHEMMRDRMAMHPGGPPPFNALGAPAQPGPGPGESGAPPR